MIANRYWQFGALVGDWTRRRCKVYFFRREEISTGRQKVILVEVPREIMLRLGETAVQTGVRGYGNGKVSKASACLILDGEAIRESPAGFLCAALLNPARDMFARRMDNVDFLQPEEIDVRACRDGKRNFGRIVEPQEDEKFLAVGDWPGG